MTDGLYGGPPFSVVAWQEDETVRIDVAGEIDLATSPRLKVALLSALETPTRPKEIRIDLSGVTFIDARGVGVLVAGCEAARRCGVGFAVQNPQGIVLRVLDILCLTETLRHAPARR